MVKMGSILAKLDQAGAKQGQTFVEQRQGQTRLNRLKWDLKMVNKGKLQCNGIKLGKMGVKLI